MPHILFFLRCNGVLGTCPPSTITPISLQDGKAILTLSSFASPISFQWNTNKLHLRINGFSVNCSTFSIRWSLLKADYSCRLGKIPATLPSNTNNHILSGFNLKNTQSYKIAAQASNVRGKFGLTVCSDPVTIDTSKPTSGWVYDGISSTDLQYQSSKSFSASWGGFRSTYGIGKYEVAMFYQPQSSKDQIKIQDFLNVNLNVSFTKTITGIPDGSKLTTKLRAYTKAGLYIEIASNGVILDTSQPLSGLVSDGLNVFSDLQYANWTSSYAVSWDAFTDGHTPMIKYSVGVKRKNGGFVTSGLFAVGLKYNFVFRGLKLSSEKDYCAVVEGENAAGLKTLAYSNCLLIDHDPPGLGTVNDGTSSDIDHQSSDTVFNANWNRFDDGVRGSGLAGYKYILTDQNNENVISWISISLHTNVTIEGLNLTDGNTYYITVRAFDRVGHHRDVKSDGVYIDTTHPVYTGKIHVNGEPTQKDNNMVIYIANEGSITASWPQFVDQHSGMNKYQWSIVENHKKPTEWRDMPGITLATKARIR